MSDECVEKVDVENLKIFYFHKKGEKIGWKFYKGFQVVHFKVFKAFLLTCIYEIEFTLVVDIVRQSLVNKVVAYHKNEMQRKG